MSNLTLEEENLLLKQVGGKMATRVMQLFCSGMSDDELCQCYNNWRDIIIGKPDFSGKPGRKSNDKKATK